MRMMKCGHSANATITLDGNKIPCCAICYNSPESITVDENPTILVGRKAKCTYCSKIVDSNINLAFFEVQPNRKNDTFYCGCRGWN